MNWEFIAEANLQLTETEHRYYGDIFLYCCEHSDNDSVPVVKAAELLRSANLPRDVTVKVRHRNSPGLLFYLTPDNRLVFRNAPSVRT